MISFSKEELGYLHEVRGRAEAIRGERPLIRIHADRVRSWGVDD